MLEYEGWILDIFEDPKDGLVLYIVAQDHQRHRLTTPFPITFYALGNNTELRSLWTYLRRTHPDLHLAKTTRFDVIAQRQVPALAVTLPNPTEIRTLINHLESRYPSLNYADVDIPITVRFAAATGAYPLARCKIESDDQGQLIHIRPLESPWLIDHKPIPLETLFISPNVDPQHKSPHFLQANIHHRGYRIGLNDWNITLTTLHRIIHRFNPDLILTSWGDTWLLPLLIEKSQEYNVDLGLCRETNRKVNIIPERTYFSYGQIVYRGQQVHLYGRIHIDQKNAMLWKDYGLEGTLEACRVTALPLQTSSRVSPGTGISAIEMQTALREGVFIPYQKQQAEIFKSVSSLFSADQGGMIYQPLIGLHRNVAMIDYVSMYPAIMVYYNISPETITTNVNNGDIVPTLSFAINKNIEGLVPKALRPLLEKRIELKKRLASFSDWSPDIDTYTRAASALKWLLVVCFGYLGYKNARFGRIEAHQAVTAYSREAVLLAKEAAEDMGYQVIHMYVDGLWVAHPDKTNPDDIDPLLVEIQKRTGLPIALDGIFKWVVFVGSRGNRSRPVANRYFGVFQNGKIKVRGIDARRHDCTRFVGQSQLAVIKLLANRDDPADALPEAVKYIKHRIEALLQGDIPLENLIVKQRLSRQLEAYRSPSPAARAAMQLADIGKEVRPGQKVAFIHTLGKPGVIAWDLLGKPDPRTVDIERYKNLLLRAAGIVLETWGLDEAKLRDLMITPLFQLPLYRNQSRNKKIPPIPFTKGSSPDRRPNQQQ
jgi:DNA polymerase-2